MLRSLFIVTLIFNSCTSGIKTKEARQDTLYKVKNDLPQTEVTPKREMVDSIFLTFWKEFIVVANSKNQQAFRTMSFDSLECLGKNVHANTFMKSYFAMVFDDSLFLALSDTTRLEFISSEIDVSNLPKSILNVIKGEKCVEKIVNITKKSNYPPVIIMLKFIETKEGYKLHGYDRVG